MIIDNFKGIKHLEITPDGHNVTITGQNGTGKTSIYLAWLFVLGQNCKDITHYGSDSASVELQFLQGPSLLRQYFENAKTHSKYFIDNKAVSQIDYEAFVLNLTAGLDPRFFSRLGHFCGEISVNQRRDILLKVCAVDNNVIFDKYPDFRFIKSYTENSSINDLISELKENIKSINIDLSAIPAKIEGLQFGMKNDLPDKATLNENLSILNDKLKTLQTEILNLSAQSQPAYDIRIRKLDKIIATHEAQIASLNSSISKLIAEYDDLVKAEPGVCRLCKRPFSRENFISTRNNRIKDINLEGVKLKNDKQKLKVAIKQYQSQIQALQDAQNNCQSSNDCQRLALAHEEELRLNQDIYKVQLQISQLNDNERKIAEIERLNITQRNLQSEINDLKNKLQLINDFVRAKIKAIDEEIATKFSFVSFKTFDFYKTTGEVKDCCEALLDGKSYSTALSRGERIKVDLDCLVTLQNHFNVKLPVFIDDFESITRNSIIDLPNQIFRLKAVDGAKNLTVEIENK